jgi:hypothetical protein
MIHFITPLYRYNNLKTIYSTIKHQVEDFNWHLIEGGSTIGEDDFSFLKDDDRVKFYKIDTLYIWGHEQRNYFITNITVDDNDWCYFLDDDNVVTYDLISECENESNSDIDLILFSQKKGLTEQIRLYGLPENLKLGKCDIGSFVLRYRILKQTYNLQNPNRNSDGHFCESLNNFNSGSNFKFIRDKFVRYNALRMEIT